MANAVESRTVQMRFDNAQFEKNVSETIKSLERLNKGIDTTNASKSLKNIGNNTDTGGIAKGVESLSKRFSTLGIVGMTVIQRLTNAGIDMVSKVGSGFNKVINQMKTGGFQRAENLEQAKFLLEGLGADVDMVMKKVDKAVTGTSYGLDEAAKAAASFYASGITGGKEMESALRAVAGVAAMTGSDYASIADIFTTVAGQGRLMTMQLREMEGRGLNAAAILAKSMGKSEAEIRDMVTKGQIDFKTFSDAMDEAFGEHAQEANKTFSGSLANMKTALSRFGEAFITPAMQAAIPVFNSIREAIADVLGVLKQDGYAVANFTKFISNLGNKTSDFINKAKEIGAFKAIGEGLNHIYNAFQTVLEGVRIGFQRAFPTASVQTIKVIGKAIESFGKKIESITTRTKGFANVFSAFFNILKLFGTLIGGIFKILSPGIELLSEFANGISVVISRLSGSVADSLGNSSIFSKISNGFTSLGKAITSIIDRIINKVGEFVSKLSGAIGSMDNLMAIMTGAGLLNGLTFVKRTFTGMAYTLDTFKKTVIDTLLGFKGSIKAIAGLPQKISDSFLQLTRTLKAMEQQLYAQGLMQIAAAVLMLAIALNMLAGLDSKGLAKSLAAVTTMLGELLMVVGIIVKTMSGSFKDILKMGYVLGTVSKALVEISVAMLILSFAVKNIAQLNPKELAVGLTGMVVMLGAITGFAYVLPKLGGRVAIKLATGIILLASGLKIMANAVKTLGDLNPSGLAKGLTGLVIIMAATVGMLTTMNKFKSKTTMATAISIIAIADALNIMSSAVSSFAGLNAKELAKGLGSVIVLMGAIFGLTVGIGKLGGGGMIAAGAGMILIAQALNTLTPAISSLGNLNLATIGKGLMTISVGLVAMVLASQSVSSVGAFGILVMSTALASFANTIVKLSALSVGNIVKGLVTMAAGLGMFAASASLLVPVIPAMFLLSAALAALGIAFTTIGIGLVAIGAGLTSFSSGLISLTAISAATVTTVITMFNTLIDSILGLIPKIAKGIAKMFVALAGEIAKYAPKFLDSMTTIIGSLLDAVNNNVPKIVETAINIVDQFMKTLATHIPSIAKSGAAIVAGFINGITENIPAVIQAGFNLVISFINGLADAIRNNAGKVRDAMINLASSMLEAFLTFFGINSPSTVMNGAGVNIIQGLLNGLKSMVSKPVTVLSNMAKSMLKAITSKISSFISAAKNIGSGILSGIKSKVSSVATTIRSAINSGLSKVKGFVSSFVSAGSNIVSGIARGIRNGASSVISAVGDIASRALNRFKSLLGIHSPSKAFDKASRWIPVGAAKGIKKMSYVVEDAVHTMADKAINAMSETANDISNVLNGNLEPTITPVVDLSNVSNGAAAINSLFNSDRSLGLSTGINSIFGRNVDMTNSDVVNAINKLRKDIDGLNNNTYNINGITYDDGSNIIDAVETLVHAVKIEGRV